MRERTRVNRFAESSLSPSPTRNMRCRLFVILHKIMRDRRDIHHREFTALKNERHSLIMHVDRAGFTGFDMRHSRTICVYTDSIRIPRHSASFQEKPADLRVPSVRNGRSDHAQERETCDSVLAGGRATRCQVW